MCSQKTNGTDYFFKAVTLIISSYTSRLFEVQNQHKTWKCFAVCVDQHYSL